MCKKIYEKTCKKCKSKKIIKFGIKRWKQRYKCKECGYVYCRKQKSKYTVEKLYEEYSKWKQTYKELSKKYDISVRTVQRKLDEYKVKIKKRKPTKWILLIDTTYFWDIWVMVFKEIKSKKILKTILVEHESYYYYRKWVDELIEEWWKIEAIVCDWKRWLLWWFWNIPTQMCCFHQAAIIRRYMTKNPRLEPNRELKKIVSLLTETDKETFEYELEKWWIIYSDFLNERYIDENWKKHYVHKRTRSAYFSLKKNLKFLFVHYDYYWTIDIPTTTNGLEWYFSHIKAKLNLHRWLTKERKIKLILSLMNF